MRIPTDVDERVGQRTANPKPGPRSRGRTTNCSTTSKTITARRDHDTDDRVLGDRVRHVPLGDVNPVLLRQLDDTQSTAAVTSQKRADTRLGSKPEPDHLDPMKKYSNVFGKISNIERESSSSKSMTPSSR